MFERTTFLVTVLSDRHYENADDLGLLAYDIDEGDCVGTVERLSQAPLSPEKMAQALLDAGSEPGFFSLDESP